MEARNDRGGDDAPEPKGKASRARRPKAPKVDGGIDAKRSLNLRLDNDVYEKLNVHALMERTTVSDLVSRMTREHCRAFAVHRVGVRSSDPGA